ncbi:endonuclease/exonuclease/phosphatase family protein [Wenyingzhuangia sp. 1_MG-2023]|nr:endonuclease/exonuclease/phosphatase family protein [Wenyingzhuangia sp. 1_MG-2023]
MRKILTGVVLVASLFACSQETEEKIEPIEEKVSSDVKIMTFNIFGGFPRGADRNDLADYDLDAIIRTIKSSNSDIIGLNEISKGHKAATNYEDQPQIIAEALGYYYDFYGLEVSGKYGVALLSKYPILGISHTKYEIQGDHEKGYIEAKIQHPEGDLWVYVTHLESGDELVRYYEIQELKKASAILGEVPKLIMGDFNFTPDSDNHSFMTEGEFIDPLGKNLSPNTFNLATPKRIDYIMGNSKIKFVQEPWADTTDKTSDHFPVWAEINFVTNK